MSVQLIQTDSPITRDARNNINENWKRIVDGFSNLQLQILHITDGTDIIDLITRMEKAIADSNTSIVEMSNLITECRSKLSEIQTSITSANQATHNANQATHDANQATTSTIKATQDAINATINANKSTETAALITNNAYVATINANQAAANANNKALLAAQSIQNINGALTMVNRLLSSMHHQGEYNTITQYVTNNEVLYMGSTFRAKVDNIGILPPSDYSSNNTWQLIARRGDDAKNPEDFIQVWHGKNPPTKLDSIWWYDPNAEQDLFVLIKASDIPPVDDRNIWFSKRSV